MAGRRWTPEEDELLEHHYGSWTTERIAAALGRTPSAVHNRGGVKHLGRRRPQGVYSMHEVMQILGLPSHLPVRRWIRDGWLPGRRSPRYGRADRPEWWITEPDLIAFLRRHPEQLDRDRVTPSYQQYIDERWITFPESFRRGAAHPFMLEAAAKAGLIPLARRRGIEGTWWVIPESFLPELVAARRRMTSDADHRRLVQQYNRQRGRGNILRKRSHLLAAARAAAPGGHSGRNGHEPEPGKITAIGVRGPGPRHSPLTAVGAGLRLGGQRERKQEVNGR